MWRITSGSETGTSHLTDRLPCQDACSVAEIQGADGPVLVCVCADGAGSVKHAEVGARLACSEIIELCTALLPAGLPLVQFDEHHAREWCAFIRLTLQEEADQLQVGMEELACTLVVALIGLERSCFFQVGDGGIVIRNGEYLELVFTPEHGEFPETTYFLTDPDVGLHVHFRAIQHSVDSIAAFTDGLESLLLSFPDFAVHKPFFEKAFAAAEEIGDPAELQQQLKNLLNSSHINQRTTDDKTLILATRIPQLCKEPDHDSNLL